MFLNRRFYRPTAVALLGMLLTGLLAAQAIQTGENGKVAVGKRVMVATAHPLASKAAIEMFQKGGNAVDAAVAAAFAIGVVEPDGSGLGGGGGMLIRRKSGETIYINYYPQASSKVAEVGFVYGKDNQTAKSILVPGTVAGLVEASSKYGKLPLSTLLQPAISYAEKGFVIDETLSKIILDNVTLVGKHPDTADVYLRDGFPLQQGETLRQPGLAKTLKAISQQGCRAFYEGEVAQSLVAETVKHGGQLTLDDLRNYHASTSRPVEGSYRGYRVISAPPPHSGAMVIEALQALENVSLASLGHYSQSAESFHLLAEIIRRVYADRTAFLADPRFEKIPLTGLLSREYANTRFLEIDRNRVTPSDYRKTPSGNPLPFDSEKGKDAGKRTKGPERKVASTTYFSDRTSWLPPDLSMVPEPAGGHTTQISIADHQGNLVSLTQTLGTFFGSGVTASGVLLNNAMSNFATGNKVNCIQPGKQPRSSIAPSLLLKGKKPYMVVGSPGAARIVNTVITLIVNAVDYRLNAEHTNLAPRFLCQKADAVLSLESRFQPQVLQAMKEKGHTLQLYGDLDLFFGGSQIILIDPSTGELQGSADPRRGGVAMGY